MEQQWTRQDDGTADDTGEPMLSVQLWIIRFTVELFIQLLSMVFRRVLSTYRVIIDRLWAVSPYIFANCCSVVPSFRLVLGKPTSVELSFLGSERS